MVALILYIIGVFFVASLLAFIKSEGELDNKSMKYICLFLLFSLVNGVGMWYLLKKMSIPVFLVFQLGLLLFLLAGIVHFVAMYKLVWARRNPGSYEKDSVLREAGFTFGLSSLMTLTSFVLFGILVGKFEIAASMWGLILVFPFPFLLVKCSDFFMQVEKREFDKKWVYEIFPFDETQWKRENMISVGFVVADSMKNENKWFRKKARFSIVIPRNQELRLIYRLALREYHERNPSVPVQELGYEEGVSRFWWMFQLKSVWFKPSTWSRAPLYLDPEETLDRNQLRNGDFIMARRIPLD